MVLMFVVGGLSRAGGAAAHAPAPSAQGRFLLREEGDTIAAGVVKELLDGSAA